MEVEDDELRKRQRRLVALPKLRRRQVQTNPYHALLRVDPNELLQSRLRERGNAPKSSLSVGLPLLSIAGLSPKAVVGCFGGLSAEIRWWNGSEHTASMGVDLSLVGPMRVIIPENGPSGCCLVVCKTGLEVLDAAAAGWASNFTFASPVNLIDGDLAADGLFAITANAVGAGHHYSLHDLRAHRPQLEFSALPVTNSRQAVGTSQTQVRILGSGSHVAGMLTNGTVQVFDLRQTQRAAMSTIVVQGDVEPAAWHNGELLPATGRHPTRVVTLSSLGGNGREFITGAEEDGLRIWDISTGRCREHFPTCDGWFAASTTRASSSFYCFANGQIQEFVESDPTRPIGGFFRPEYWGRELCASVVGNTYDALVCGNVLGQFVMWH
ncbi:hypothetical protein BASA81_012344 [Batrachochytrium salamandrivorans]|nr:hypothetical protein BASA81_012344 [Batrachochytrium salamandrivorans]